MKKILFTAACAAAMLALVPATNAQLADIFYDDFSYAAGALTTNGAPNWVTSSGTAGQVTISAGSLAYPGLMNVAGGKISLVTANSEDVRRDFTNQPVGTGASVYASFQLRATAAAAGSYFAHFHQGQSTLFMARLFCRANATNPEYGLTYNSGTADYSGSVTTVLNTTDFIVLRFTSVVGSDNDTASLWVNPAIGGSEPAPNITRTAAAGADIATGIGAFSFRQAAGGVAAEIDTLRVGTTWASVTSAQVPVELSVFSAN